MASTLADWWPRLETAALPSGPRRHLQDLFGEALVAALERTGILKPGGAAATYPCPRRSSSDGCPRILVPVDAVWHAVCGNGPAECEDLILAPADVTVLKLDPLRLCQSLAAALQIRPAAEAVTAMAGAWRVGTFMPDPGVRYPVYLLLRGSTPGYAEGFDALRVRQDGGPFAVLVPTDRFLSDAVGRSMRGTGGMVLALADVVGLDEGRWVALADPLRLFGGLGRKPAPFGHAPVIVARALVREAGRPPAWVDLDQRGYEELLAATGHYDVVANERDRSVRKTPDDHHQNVLVSHFRTIQAAVTRNGRFDPNVEGPDMASGKQIFQRARALFDLKTGKSSWRIFPSVRTDEGHAVYRFAPDAEVSFAFIFLPDS